MKRFVTLITCGIIAASMVFGLCACAGSTYEPKKKAASVQPPVIGEANTLRVGVNMDNNPFSSQKSGKTTGIDIDMAAAIADNMGLSLALVDVGSNPEGALQDGSVDIVMGLDSSTSYTCWTSEYYLQSGVALFAAPGTTALPSSGSVSSIAAQASSMSSWEVTNQFGESAFLSVSDPNAAFDSLKAGNVSYVACDAVIGSFLVHSGGYQADVIAMMEKPTGYSIGASKTATALQSALTTTIATLSKDGTFGVIKQKWLGSDTDLSTLTVTSGAKASAGAISSSSSSSSSATPTDSTTSGSVGSNAVQL